MLVVFYGQTRILLAMSRDGLLPKFFSRINPNTKTPTTVIIGTGTILAIIAGFAPIGTVAEMANIGTLAAFVAVCIGVIVLRNKRPDLHRPFKTPFMPVLPILGVAGCLWLMSHLGPHTWMYFLIWMTLGLIVYFLYSMRSSVLARQSRASRISVESFDLSAGVWSTGLLRGLISIEASTPITSNPEDDRQRDQVGDVVVKHQHHLHADECQDQHQGVLDVAELLHEPRDGEIERAQAENRERVRREDDERILGYGEDRRDRVDREHDVGEVDQQQRDEQRRRGELAVRCV